MNYSEMTEFEINCAVLADIEPDVEHMQLSADQKSFYHCGYDGNGFYETAIPDYCNSWTDAGPIIEKHLICLAADVFAEPQDGGKWVAQPAYGWDSERVRSEKPLRAAMIVFLMMQEGK